MKALLHNRPPSLSKTRSWGLEAYLIDQFCKPDLYYRHLKGQDMWIKTKHTLLQRRSPPYRGCGCSMVASIALPRWPRFTWRQYGYEPSGAGANVDKAAAIIFKTRRHGTLAKWPNSTSPTPKKLKTNLTSHLQMRLNRLLLVLKHSYSMEWFSYVMIL